VIILRDIFMPHCVHNATHNLTSILHCRFVICLKTWAAPSGYSIYQSGSTATLW